MFWREKACGDLLPILGLRYWKMLENCRNYHQHSTPLFVWQPLPNREPKLLGSGGVTCPYRFSRPLYGQSQSSAVSARHIWVCSCRNLGIKKLNYTLVMYSPSTRTSLRSYVSQYEYYAPRMYVCMYFSKSSWLHHAACVLLPNSYCTVHSYGGSQYYAYYSSTSSFIHTTAVRYYTTRSMNTLLV